MKKLLTLASLMVVGCVMLSASATAESGSTGATTRVSVSSTGLQGNYDSYPAGISAGGRYVVFGSWATDLVPGDTNARRDVFVRDRKTGRTTRVSISSSGREATCSNGFGCSDAAGISADGRYVAFVSEAANLVPGDTNGASDVFVHDRKTGRTTRVSVSTRGRQANGSSGFAAISADGRYVAFGSSASNLVARDTNGAADIFSHDRKTGRTTRVSVGRHGRQALCDVNFCESTGPALSAHGRYVAFTSLASNLVRGDSNHLPDVFVRDLATGQTQRVSVSSSGSQAKGRRHSNGSNAPSISADGRYVAFHSDASNLVRGDTNRTEDIFLHDRKTGTTTRVSVGRRGGQANGESLGPPSISPDGRYVAFASLASNLVAGDTNDITDVFLHDCRTGRTILVSRSSDGDLGNDGSAPGAISANDRYLAFTSWASNLVPGDTNRAPDAFVRELR
jgi:Tol biopolymer transport system component